jgi:uncharacterized membrane protein
LHLGANNGEVVVKARVLVAGHALHAQLVVFPLGLLGLSPLWDILRLSTGRASWAAVAYRTIVAGVVSALVAAVPGYLDFRKIPAQTRAKRIGKAHLIINLVVVGLFVVSLLLREAGARDHLNAGVTAMLPGWVAVALAVVSGWLGGELVETLGIGVHEGANPNAASSLREGAGVARVAPPATR